MFSFLHFLLHTIPGHDLYNAPQAHIHMSTQPALTCLRLTIETLEQGVKYVKVNNISIFNFEPVIAGWVLIELFTRMLND